MSGRRSSEELLIKPPPIKKWNKILSRLSVKILKHPSHVTTGFCSLWQLDFKGWSRRHLLHIQAVSLVLPGDARQDMCQATNTLGIWCAFLNTHLVHGNHTGQTGRGFFFFCYRLPPHVHHQQLEGSWYETNLASGFFFHSSTAMCKKRCHILLCDTWCQSLKILWP